MTRSELGEASRLLGELRRAEERRDAVIPLEVVGVMLGREGGGQPIRLERGGCSGTGSVMSIGWPEGLQVALTEAFTRYFDGEIMDLRSKLTAIGVSDVGRE